MKSVQRVEILKSKQWGIDSDIQRPLATVIVYGLLFSSLITLFFLPIYYYLIEL